MTEKRNSYIQTALFAGLFIILIVVLNNVLSVGYRLGLVHYLFEITFYLICVGLFYVFGCYSDNKCFKNA